MSNSRLLLLGASVAVLAAVLAALVQRMFTPAGSDGSVVTTVQAARNDLPAGHRLVEGDLEPTEAPIGTGPKTAATEARPLVGRALATPARKGQVIRQEMLAARGSAADIAAQLPQGHRALTVMLRDPIAASSLFPGAVVDVLVTVDRTGAGNTKDSVTRTAIERARVLAITDDLSVARAAAASEGIAPADRRATPAKKVAVTLDVLAEQAAELELASSRGVITLALRASGDTGTSVPAGAPRGSEAANAAAPASNQAQASVWEITIIRGDAVSREQFLDRGGARRP